MKLIALYNHPADPKTFDEAYFGTHIPLIKKVPGLLDSKITRLRASLRGHDYYLMAELYFEDDAAFKIGMNSPEMAAAGENLDSFAKGEYTLIFGVEEDV